MLVALLFVLQANSAAAQQAAFDTADAAVAALMQALEKNDKAMLGTLLGPDSEDIFSSGDEVADANALAELPDGDGATEGDDITVVLLAPPT